MPTRTIFTGFHAILVVSKKSKIAVLLYFVRYTSHQKNYRSYSYQDLCLVGYSTSLYDQTSIKNVIKLQFQFHIKLRLFWETNQPANRTQQSLSQQLLSFGLSDQNYAFTSFSSLPCVLHACSTNPTSIGCPNNTKRTNCRAIWNNMKSTQKLIIQTTNTKRHPPTSRFVEIMHTHTLIKCSPFYTLWKEYTLI